jgi:hypothetical protein
MWFHGVQKDFNNVFHGISKDIDLEDTEICFTYLGVQTGDDFYGFNHAYSLELQWEAGGKEICGDQGMKGSRI